MTVLNIKRMLGRICNFDGSALLTIAVGNKRGSAIYAALRKTGACLIIANNKGCIRGLLFVSFCYRFFYYLQAARDGPYPIAAFLYEPAHNKIYNKTYVAKFFLQSF